MAARRWADWFFRLLFPVVLFGVVIYSFLNQPALISSPQIKAGFAGAGSGRGFLEDAAPAKDGWPPDLPSPLAEALESAFGVEMPRAGSFYYFGQARRRWGGLWLPVGFETVLLPGRGFSRRTALTTFGFQIRLWESGLRDGQGWFKINGRAREAEEPSLFSAGWLEQAALLLPLAKAGLTWEKEGSGRLRADLGQGRSLVLEFDRRGEETLLTRASLGAHHLRPEAWSRFGDYRLPSVLAGSWGQAELIRLDLQGLVLNPPFGREALDQASGGG